jgi:tetraacyldisaccharide 4'-kinase
MLAPFAAAYGGIAAWRMGRPGRGVGPPVICIGNLTVGGAGKTPAALAVAQMLCDAGRRPFMLTRGYGGRLAGPVRVDAARHGARDVGDEALLLARVAPTIVAGDRVGGAAAARAAGADVIVMDDGFQNPALAKDLSLIVVDGQRGIGNGAVFPAGPLRAPLDAQLDRAQALLVVGPPQGAGAVAAAGRTRGLPVFHGRLEPDADAVAALKGRKVLAFAGIGDPEKFFQTLAEAGIAAPLRQAFADHHRYGRGDATDLVARAERDGLLLLTTEKDMARMAGDGDAAALAARAKPLPVRLAVEDETAFRDLILTAAR